MSQKRIFDGFSEEKHKQYEQEAIKQYGEDKVRPSIKRWNSYTEAQQEQIKQEGSAIYTELAENMDRGADSPEVQAILARWRRHLRYFYEPSLERLRGLGNMYNDQPEFNETFSALHPDLPAFLQKAINHYVDRLERAD